jgi:hypothetical protein
MNAGAAVAARQRKIIRAFEEGGATSPRSARALGDLGVADSPMLKHLVRRGLVLATEDGRHYLDVEAAEEYQHRRRIIGLFATGIMIMGLVIYLIFK